MLIDNILHRAQNQWRRRNIGASQQIEDGEFAGYTFADRIEVISYRFRVTVLRIWQERYPDDRAAAAQLETVAAKLKKAEAQ